MSGGTTINGGGEGGIVALVAAPYPATRAGLMALLGSDPRIRPLRPQSAPGGSEPAPDVIVADLSGGNDRTADDLAEAYPGAPQVLLGADPAIQGPGLAAGPVAYLPLDADGPALVAAVWAVLAGLVVIDPEVAGVARIHGHAPLPASAGTPGEALTARELEVLALVAEGLPNKAIARELGISEHTAKFHVGSLLGKLGAGSRTEAVTLATRRGVLAI
ncbi:MAG TPA: response regulator transcription factor [Thermomicrobiales bacterium]|nr:response regulator transcription factor [Thermomicrobiales bacterium]